MLKMLEAVEAKMKQILVLLSHWLPFLGCHMERLQNRIRLGKSG